MSSFFAVFTVTIVSIMLAASSASTSISSESPAGGAVRAEKGLPLRKFLQQHLQIKRKNDQTRKTARIAPAINERPTRYSSPLGWVSLIAVFSSLIR